MSSPESIPFGEMIDAMIDFESAAAGRRSATWTRNVRRWRRRMEDAEDDAEAIEFALAWAYRFCWTHSQPMRRWMPKPASIPDTAAEVARREARREARIANFVAGRAPYRHAPAFKPLHRRPKLVARYAVRAALLDEVDRARFLAARRTGALKILAKGGIEGKDAGLAADRFTSEIARVAALQRGRGQ